MDATDRVQQRRELSAVVLWAGLFGVAVVWGRRLLASNVDLALGAVPLFGRWHLRISVWAVPAAVFAAVVIVAGPAVIRRMRFGWLLVTTAAATAAWAVLLALVDGPSGITQPLRERDQYLPFLPRVGHVGPFLDTFVRRLPGYPVHVRGHPPGMVLLLDGLDRAGLGGAGWAAALVIAGYAGGVVVLLLTVRMLAGERSARLCAPFIAFAPAAMNVATTGDALFAGVALASIALFAWATQREGRSADLIALLAGVTLGAAIFLSYGLAVVAAALVALAVVRRRLRLVVAAAIGVAGVVAIFLADGFWWFAGLRATTEQYRIGVAHTRPYRYFLLADIAVFGLIIGPATVAALARLQWRNGRWRSHSLVPLLGVAMVALVDLSGFSKAEVERIWLFLVAPVAVATASLARPGSDVVRRGWLAAQVLAGLGLQVALRNPW